MSETVGNLSKEMYFSMSFTEICKKIAYPFEGRHKFSGFPPLSPFYAKPFYGFYVKLSQKLNSSRR